MESSEASWRRPQPNYDKRGKKAQPDSDWGPEVALHAEASVCASQSFLLSNWDLMEKILEIEGMTLMEV